MLPDGNRNLRELENAGVPLSALTEQQRSVFAGLSRAELELFLDIKARLDEAEPEVQAHSEVAGAALF